MRQNVATALVFWSKKSSKKPDLVSGGGYEYRSPSSPNSVTQSTGSLGSTNEKRSGRYKKRTTGVVQNAEIIGFDANQDIRLGKRQVSVAPILFLQFDDHDSLENP